MKYIIINIILSVVVFASCNKEEIVVVSDYENERLILDGMLTNKFETQSIKVNLANNIGDSNILPITDVSVSISSSSQFFNFSLVNENVMISTAPFQATPDTIYTIHYCYKGSCGQKDFVMPNIITAEAAVPAEIPFSNTFYQLDLDLTLSSEAQQWCRLEVYELDSVFNGDSIWAHLPHPIYDVFQITNSDSEHYEIQDVIPGIGIEVNNSFFKIYCYSLSSETGEYLRSLDVFMNSEFTGSQYQNPPNYFDDGTLGLIYGSVMDSVYLQY